MEKRAIGVILTILGVIGLIIGAYYFIDRSSNVYNIKVTATSAIIGLIFFFAGIGLIRSTKDVIRKDENIS